MIDHNQAILKDEFDRQIFYKLDEIKNLNQTISIYEKDIEEKQREINTWKERIKNINIIITELEKIRDRI